MSGIGSAISIGNVVALPDLTINPIVAVQPPHFQRLYVTQSVGDIFEIDAIRSFGNYVSSTGSIVSVEVLIGGVARDNQYVLSLGEAVTVRVTNAGGDFISWLICAAVEFAVQVSDEADGTATLEFNDIVDPAAQFEVTVTAEPWASRGVWPVLVSRNAYENDRISLTLPEITGSAVFGEAPTFTPGLYGTDLSGSTTYTLQVDGVNVSGFVDVSFASLGAYTNVAGDLTLIELHDGVAIHTSAAFTVATVVTVASYDEVGATGNKAASLTGAANFAAEAQTALIALSFDYTQVNNASGTLLNISGSSLKVSFAAQEIRTQVWNATHSRIINQDTAPLSAGDRVNVLIALNSNGTSTFVMSVNGGAWSTEWTKLCSDTAFSLDGSLGVVSASNGSEKAPVIHYRTAIWTGITLPDVTSTAVQALFFNNGTSVDPATAVAAYGTPVIDLYGDAEALNTGVHNGTYNSGTALTGGGFT